MAGEPPARSLLLPSLLAPTETETTEAEAPLPPEQRLGIAIVGLGRLTLQQILPALAQTKLCRPVALVSGHRAKAEQVASHYGVASKNIYDYAGFDRIADNDRIAGVYIKIRATRSSGASGRRGGSAGSMHRRQGVEHGPHDDERATLSDGVLSDPPPGPVAARARCEG